MRHMQVLNALAVILGVFALTMFVPLAIAWHYQDGAEAAYDEAIIAALGTALLLWLVTYRKRRDLTVRDGFLLVALTWVVLPFFAALPLFFHIDSLSFTDAYFEAMSGLTATGATVLSGLDHLPLSINFWRMQLHWVGGMGVIVLAVAILPLLGIGGRQLFKAETPGPMKESALTPRIAETAKGLWGSLCAADHRLHFCPEPVRHGNLGCDHARLQHHGSGRLLQQGCEPRPLQQSQYRTGGHGLCLLSGINFATHFMALRSKSLRPYRSDAELPYYLSTLALSILGLSVYLQFFGV